MIQEIKSAYYTSKNINKGHIEITRHFLNILLKLLFNSFSLLTYSYSQKDNPPTSDPMSQLTLSCHKRAHTTTKHNTWANTHIKIQRVISVTTT